MCLLIFLTLLFRLSVRPPAFTALSKKLRKSASGDSQSAASVKVYMR